MTFGSLCATRAGSIIEMFLLDPQNERKAIYFAFPKCASDWVRHAYMLKCNNKFDKVQWHRCDKAYCHVAPEIFLREHGLEPTSVMNYPLPMFSTIRNTYDRLASAWQFGVNQRSFFNYATIPIHSTFPKFIASVCAKVIAARERSSNSSNSSECAMIFEELVREAGADMAWMYMPANLYFNSVLDQVCFYRSDTELAEFVDHLQVHHNVGIRCGSTTTKIVNASRYDRSKIYYTPEMIQAVQEAFAYEIQRWNFEPPCTD